jgi:O-antigen/teichoic acid export membrane protein
MSNLREKLYSDVIVSAILSISNRLQSIFFLVIITSSLGAKGYGAIMQLFAVITIVLIVSTFSLREAYENISQENEIDPDKLYFSILSFVIGMSIISMGLVIIFSHQLSALTLSDPAYQQIFFIGSLLIPARVIGAMGRGYFRAQMRIKTGSILRSSLDFIRILTIIVSIYGLNADLVGIVTSLVLAEAMYSVIIQIVVLWNIDLSMPSIEYLQRSLGYSGWLVFSRIGSQISSKADRLLLGFFIGASAVGIYSIAYGLGGILLMLVHPINYAIFPEFSRLLSDGRREMVSKITNKGIEYYLLLITPAIVGLTLTSDDILSLIISNDVQEAAEVVPTVALGISLLGLGQLYGTSLIANKLTKQVSLIQGGASAANVLLNLVLIPPLGVLGAAFSTAVTYALSSGLIFNKYRQTFNFDLNWVHILRIGVATSAMAIGIRKLPMGNVIVIIPTGILIYFVVMIILGWDEIFDLKYIFNKY